MLVKMEKISWAIKIRQLYENDARGTVDEVMVEDVGLALLQRCQSIWLVTHREVECPRCGAEFLDQLSARPGGVGKEQWCDEVKQMYANRRGQNERSRPALWKDTSPFRYTGGNIR